MRFAIEACTWANRRGYGRFTRMLVSTMIERHPEHEFVLVADQVTAAEGKFPPGAKLEVVKTRLQPTEAASADGSRPLGDLWRMARAASRVECDAFFFPTNYSYYPLLNRTPAVVVFHDAIAEQHPGLIFPGWRSRLFWGLKSWLARRQARKIVTVSEDARVQLSNVFGLAAAEIEVVSEGPDPCFRVLDREAVAAAGPLLAKFGLPAEVPLVLYVGGISPHKNLQGLLQAMAKVPAQPWHLVLVGDYAKDSFYGCYREVSALADTLGLSSRVTFTGYVSDEDLVVLCNRSTLLVLPSFSEGFGLPVIEAMACGLPVAASRRNSLPEIVGEAGLLFDPTSPSDMAEAIGRLLADAELRKRLRALGLSRAESYSWKAGADKTVAVLEGVARGRR
jgi:glycosyltransferase involved in cell wall biosynthesis